MSLDTSDESLPDWVAEHASPWLQTLAPQQTDSSPNSDKIEDTQLTNHERRPEGPSKADDGAKLDVEKAVVKPSLVIASDLPGQVPVLLPEKLSTSRCLIEVVDSVSTDLAGDAGAVGRFSIVQHGQQQQAQLDLKGAVYSMTVVPCASTLCVVNIRQTEARVETVLSEFIQLGHEATQNTTQVGLPPSWLRSYQRELLPALHITSMLFHFWPVYKILSASISSAHCYWWGCRVTTSCVHS
ncbi:hypothetical protein ABBQ32_004296 [Trebouxia sp. C0010 RCD-2024]